MIIQVSDAVTLHHSRDDRFKTARLSLYTVLPATAEKSGLCSDPRIANSSSISAYIIIGSKKYSNRFCPQNGINAVKRV